MRLKTYQAPDLAAALAAARAELGPDALVLATNEVRGHLGLTSIEITVAVDRQADTASVTPSAPAASHARTSALPPAKPKVPEVAAPVPEPTHAAIEQARTALVCSGLSADLAARFARIASRNLVEDGDAQAVAAAAETGLAELLRFAPTPVRSRVLFVVGPPGAGKTTTVAKLAARIALTLGRPVVYAQTDVERIGSVEQADIYSRHIGARLAPISAADELHEVVQQADERACVLVDTAGIGAADAERLAALRELHDAVPHADTALLLPGGLHRDEARRVIERFADLQPTCAGLARVDDCQRLGDLVTALARSRLPLAFVTNGHRVPDDLQQASPRGLIAMLIRSGCGATTAEEIAR